MVGSEGPAAQGTLGGAVTPSWGTSQSRTAGNFLSLSVDGVDGTAFPATPSGWTLDVQQVQGSGNTAATASVFSKIAAGGDSAPTIAGIAGIIWVAKLNEFSGVASSSPLDQTASGGGSTSPVSLACAGADAAAGDLIVAAGGSHINSGTNTNAGGHSFNNGASANSVNNNSTNASAHYDFAWGVTTGNSAADTDSFTASNTLISILAVMASYKAAASAAPALPFQGVRSRRASPVPRRRPLQFSAPTPPQLNPPFSTTWWKRPITVMQRSIAPRKARRFDLPIHPQVNPPFSTDFWRRAFLVANRIYQRRAKRYDLPIRPQVNPAFDTGWWRRPIKAMLRSIAPRRARRFEPPWPQRNPLFSSDFWRRAFQVGARTIAPRRARRFTPPWPQVNPPFPPEWWRRSIAAMLRSIAPRKGRRSEPPWPQVAVTPNPSFVEFFRRRQVLRWFQRRGERYDQVPDQANPLASSRSRRTVPLLRRRRWIASVATPDAIPARLRRRLSIGVARRARRFEPPWAQLVVIAPAIVEFWRKRRLAPLLRPWRARIFQPPWVGAAQVVVPLILLAVTGYSRAMSVIGKSRAMAVTGLSRAKAVVGRSRSMVATGISRITRITGRTR